MRAREHAGTSWREELSYDPDTGMVEILAVRSGPGGGMGRYLHADEMAFDLRGDARLQSEQASLAAYGAAADRGDLAHADAPGLFPPPLADPVEDFIERYERSYHSPSGA